MNKSFAIIAEGITDQFVLKNIILGFFEAHDEEPAVNFEQPLLDATGQSTLHAPGGWTLVQQYFRDRKFIQALSTNQYLVIHLDADIAADLGISLVQNQQQRTQAELVEDIITYLSNLIGEEIWSIHQSRFLFAIGSDSIECWLLPLVFDRSKRVKLKKTTGCLNAVNDELRKQDKSPLSQVNSKGRGDSKDADAYQSLAEQFATRSDVTEAAKHNPGFSRFVEQLEPIEAAWLESS